MANELTNYIVDTPVHTKIEDIKKKMSDLTIDKLVERIKATTSELVKLQYMMREYSVLQWYEKLGERQKKLHGVFENNVESIKALVGEKYNWVVLSDTEIEVTEKIRNVSKFDDGGNVWIGFLETSNDVEEAIKTSVDDKLEGMLFTPIFSVSK